MGSSNVSKLVKALDDHPYGTLVRGDETLLGAACEHGLVDLAMCFIKAGAQIIEGPLSLYGTYLHHICRSRCILSSPDKTVELVKILHKGGCDLFAQNMEGQTPYTVPLAAARLQWCAT